MSISKQICTLNIYDDGTCKLQAVDPQWRIDGGRRSLKDLDNKRVSLDSLVTELASRNKINSTHIPTGCRHIVEDNNVTWFTFMTPAFEGVAAINWDMCASNEDDLAWDRFPAHLKVEYQNNAYNSSGNVIKGIRSVKFHYPASCIIARCYNKNVAVNGTKKYTLDKMFAFAVVNYAEPLATLNLYAWPFCNVYDNGRLCIGDIPTEFTEESLAALPQYLYNGVNNSDLTSSWLNHLHRLTKQDAESKQIPYLNTKSICSFILSASKAGYIPFDYIKMMGDYRSMIGGLTSVKY